MSDAPLTDAEQKTLDETVKQFDSGYYRTEIAPSQRNILYLVLSELKRVQSENTELRADLQKIVDADHEARVRKEAAADWAFAIDANTRALSEQRAAMEAHKKFKFLTPGQMIPIPHGIIPSDFAAWLQNAKAKRP